MLTLKTAKGKHIITYKGVERECKSLKEAWARAFCLRAWIKAGAKINK